MFGKINLITPPDTLFNTNLSYLLVKPSTNIKIEFQQVLSQIADDVNVYIYDESEPDIAWLLNAARQADIIIIDLDNCDPTTSLFVSLLLIQSNTVYFTEQDHNPWSILSRNRIYDFDWILDLDHDDDEDEDIDDEE